VPTNPDAIINPEDAWLFAEPVYTFDPGTPLTTVSKKYNLMRTHPRSVGKTESRLILKVRHLHYSDYVKVLGADVVKEKETA
jgi:hypothetical protein